jgi:hypothetical protein
MGSAAGAEAVLLLPVIQGAIWPRELRVGFDCWARDDRPPAGSRMARSRR